MFALGLNPRLEPGMGGGREFPLAAGPRLCFQAASVFRTAFVELSSWILIRGVGIIIKKTTQRHPEP